METWKKVGICVLVTGALAILAFNVIPALLMAYIPFFNEGIAILIGFAGAIMVGYVGLGVIRKMMQ